MTGATYGESGVSLEANDIAVELIAKRIAQAGATRPEVVGGIGGFAAGFSAGGLASLRDPVLVSATDGVGTKLTIAQALGRHDTVGFDVVAMNVDDLVCVGAEPLFFLDYVSCGRNDPERIASIVGGVAEACAVAGCALVGGEISEHPGVMDPDEYDLVGFCVGVVDRAAMLGPDRVRAGDAVIGLASSGPHSNGYSLVRRLILDRDWTLDMPVPGCDGTLGDELLTPTRIYAPAVLEAVRATEMHAAAHITGGGIAGNLARALPEGLGARLERHAWTTPPLFAFLQQAGGIAEDEMARVFNLGVGMAVVVAASDAARACDVLRARGEAASVIGEVVEGHGVEVA